MEMTRVRMTVVTLVAVLAALLMPAPKAMAQGQGFAPPMSTEALERSLGRYVRPSPEAREEIHAAHDRYMAEFRKLQDSDLDAFEKQPPPFMTGGDMGAWMRRYSSLRGRINTLDAAFLTEVAQALPEDQRASVERVRWVRETQVLRSGFLAEIGNAMGGGGRVDLGDLFYTAGLNEQELARIDPLLREHESRLLGVARRSSDETERLLLDFTDRLQKMGLWGDALVQAQQDPEKAMEMYRQTADLMREIFTAMAESSARVAEINRRSYREIRDQISFDALVKVHPRWLMAGVPQLGGQFPDQLINIARRAKERPGVSDESKDAIDRITADTVRRVVSMLDASEAAIDASMKQMMARQFDPEEMGSPDLWQEEAERQRQDNEARAKVVESAIQSILSHLPPEEAEKLRGVGGMGEVEVDLSERMFLEVAPSDDEGGDDDTPARFVSWEVGIPLDSVSNEIRPYSVAELKRLLGYLALDASTQQMIETLHGDYMARFAEEVQPLQQEFMALRGSIYDFSDGSPRMSIEKVRASFELIPKIISMSDEIDRDFFGSLAAIVGDEHAPSVKVEQAGRSTRTLGRVQARSMEFTPNAEQPLDVVAILFEDFKPASDERAIITKVLQAHLEPLDSAARRAFEVNLNAAREMEVAQAEIFVGSLNMEDQARAGVEFQRRMERVTANLREANKARSATQRAAIDAVIETLPEPRGRALDRTRDRAHFPGVFNDSAALHDTFAKVEKLPDLTDAQRVAVVEALFEYEEAYEIACDGILAATAAPMPESRGNNQEYWMALQNRERGIERMKFERNEVNARAAARLRAVLTPEQLAHFRNLTDPARTGQSGRRSPW
ncbi:MAG: hypothetical protein KF724_08490 [Phycisphaeraceae bacterium]|nr:hypothetical protein [Phycisphaeraceae bacterium]